MNGRRVTGAVAGALLAGLGLSALMMAGEKKTGKPSELADLERKAAERLGRDTPPASQLPGVGEQTLTQGRHLLLSAIAGAAYAAGTDEEAAIVPSGILFGLAFLRRRALAHRPSSPRQGARVALRRQDDRHARRQPHRLRHCDCGSSRNCIEGGVAEVMRPHSSPTPILPSRAFSYGAIEANR